MSIETDAANAEAGEEVDALARELGERIADMPLYERYREAKAEVEADEDLQDQIREFEQIREEFMLARQTNEATQEDLRTLQDAQEELHDHPKMSEYLELQSELELRLQELNEIISEPLTVDFGGKAGGCCED
ncbi:YlbF family regulator [Halosimplex pelagicum]|uniref:YlbF family regulator n=1 Tax=Halosimplex pelagicum TaxID=869886 RepID=A0A7D5PD74_9EURY|nr:YlbF family regulator [Halosimplex pelagicum]QLH83882.1 YlbF family regulator [Halosimplex pelagicum]